MTAGSSVSLAKLQAAFAAGLAGAGDSVPPEVTSRNCPAPIKRFSIHRNNVLAGLSEVLRSRYPVVERLVGGEFFQASAKEFVVAHPPRSPALFEYGAGFADFLAQFEPAKVLPYLPDVARLEWLRHAAYHATDAEPMGGDALASVPADKVGAMVLRLHPSAGLLTSLYPVLSIWQTNAMDREVRRIGPELGGEEVLVLRPGLEVRMVRLRPGGSAFIGATGEGATLAAAAEAATASATDFSLAETLGECLAAGAFTSFSFEGDVS
jgi:hypothetical protein